MSSTVTGIPQVSIFWDYERCPPPDGLSGNELVNNIRRSVQESGHIKSLKAYFDISSENANQRSASLLSELQSSGVTLVHCPRNGSSDVGEKMMIVDMLVFALDNSPPAPIVIITGDRSFTYAAAILRRRGYRITVVAPHTVLATSNLQADELIDWEENMTNANVPGVALLDVNGSAARRKSGQREKNTESSMLGLRPSSNSLSGTDSGQLHTHSFSRSERDDALVPKEPTNMTPCAGLTSNPGITSSSSSSWPYASGTRIYYTDYKIVNKRNLDDGGHDEAHCRCSICVRTLEVPRKHPEVTSVVQRSEVPTARPISICPTTSRSATSHLDLISSSSIETPSDVSSGTGSIPTSQTDPTSNSEDVTATPDADSITRFRPLIDVFVDERASSGLTQFRSSLIASKMLKRDAMAYGRAGVRRMKEYVEEARLANVLYTSGDDGDSWIEMNESLYPILQRFAVDAILERLDDCLEDDTEADPTSVPEDAITRFRPLIDVFVEERACSGLSLFRSSFIASKMLTRDSMAYERAGVRRMKQYVEEARLANVLYTSDNDGDSWIGMNESLYPTLQEPAIDAIFEPLVDRLRAADSHRLPNFILETFFKEKHPQIYNREPFSDYLEKAEAQGIVRLCSTYVIDMHWVELAHAFRDA